MLLLIQLVKGVKNSSLAAACCQQGSNPIDVHQLALVSSRPKFAILIFDAAEVGCRLCRLPVSHDENVKVQYQFFKSPNSDLSACSFCRNVVPRVSCCLYPCNNHTSCFSQMVKGVMKKSPTVVCSMWCQCYPEVLSCAGVPEPAVPEFFLIADFNYFHLWFLLYKWYPMLLT
ncbi:hypothetical protein DAPPUDRAFT_98753 [Daphnia pulex]|uniref:Uncharacterized protein n=1 Tax=Daphnia pulex TaxID=6669 RepID=E9G5R2_DAPPU|nr:hypothetical protein DAPPUDRAFT_98753 [Daphnia pulex]|eukprot:EFX85256.1 hypothetical protein DAPPUDRAFT_98753 [Daphnia pulex]